MSTAHVLTTVAVLVTLALGAVMRLSLAGLLTLPLDFHHLRHAHSHLGAYGVLFPLAFLAWRARGAPVPGARESLAYALATTLAFAGFLRAGYGPEAIVGSTIVGASWLASAFRLRAAVRRFDDPLALVPPGIVAAMACVPFIALTLRRDPALAQQLVATFLGALLLVVVTPSALASLGVRAWPTPLLTVAGLAGAAALGVWPSPVARLGLALYALWLASAARERSLGWSIRLSWLLVGLGLLAMAAGVVPNARPAVIGAIHFLVLGPVLLSLAPRRWPIVTRLATPPLLVALSLHSGALVLQAFEAAPWSLAAAALGGLLAVAWWAIAALWPER
ncbi:MAG: hypothetical protein JNJ54_21240 [Myxococcaceae bacterium]|nr:hypothetical protein [Myxococcaceae bacterium]